MAGKKKRDYSKTKRKDNGTPIQIRVSKELRATIERNAKACKQLLGAGVITRF